VLSLVLIRGPAACAAATIDADLEMAGVAGEPPLVQATSA
jgi:hypothetical protein